MRIGELSKKYGIERRAVDYYTSVGIIPCEKNKNSDYREYGADAENAVKKIMVLREIGFSANKIKNLLDNMECLNASVMEEYLKILKKKKQKAMQQYDEIIRYTQEEIKHSKKKTSAK